MKNKSFLISAIIASSLSFTSCSEKKAENDRSNKIVKVETLTLNGSSIDGSRNYSGTVQEEEGTAVSFSTAGTLKNLTVKPGDRVAAGQVIGKLDDSSLKSAYEIAKATLAQAQDGYNRMKILHDSNSLPDVKWVDIQQKLIQAQNAVDIAKNALDDATLKAPFSGIISEKYADVGQVVAPGIPVVKLVTVARVKAAISVPENEISQFKLGQKAEINVLSVGKKNYTGKLTEKGISANSLSRAYDVKFTIDNPKGELLPGMICNVKVPTDTLVDAFILPQSAVLLDEKNVNFVWIVSDSVAKRQNVKISNLRSNGIEVTDGLNPGDKVIIKGMQKVCNGTKVESIND